MQWAKKKIYIGEEVDIRPKMLDQPPSGLVVCKTVPVWPYGQVNVMHELSDGTLLLAMDKVIRRANIGHHTTGCGGGDYENIIQSFTGHRNSVECFTEVNRESFVSGSLDRTVRWWSLVSGACLQTFELHPNPVSAVITLKHCRYKPEQKGQQMIASGLCSGRIFVWNLNYEENIGSEQYNFQHTGHSDGINGLCELRDGTIVGATKGVDVLLWQLSHTNIWELQTLSGHTKSVMEVVELLNGHLLSTSKDKTMRLWDVVSKTCVQVVNHAACSLTTTC
eukprot:TRINITY_DN1550_c0_g1_i1.p1 TRINITY_DN1550_c0_g1~~TRINITY_DN1550_c0_g1_i1.p1  ORF type:complete len:303 (-),score=42.48 TRINITY_DN1550_c0_g1_i1:253-1089(-)